MTGNYKPQTDGVWLKIAISAAGAVSVMAGPTIYIINGLLDTSKEHAQEIAVVKQRQVADHSFQTTAAVQQWCDAVIRELEREAQNHRDYFMQSCPSAIPPVSVYHPPAPPWGTEGIKQ